MSVKRYDFGPLTAPEHPKGKFVLFADFHKERRESREAQKHLKNLIKVVEEYAAWMDKEMRKPSDHERGSRIAKALNSFEYVKDCAKLFGLPRKVKK